VSETVAPVPRRRGRRGLVLTALGALPFFLYVAVFLLLPIGVLAIEAFRATDPVTFEETWSTDSIVAITDGAYRRAYLGSLQLSLITAVLGAVLGLALAVAILRSRRGLLLRRLVLTAAGVLANFGGIPLAFAFLATIGNAGVVTALLTDQLGLDGFSLYSMTGLALVYLYFLIPLMVLTITPALEALRPQWREAADNLGASGWQYWRHVGGPVLAPPVIGATMLLFASAFAAYATAKALVGSSIPLVTLQIADALSSNVVVGSENLGKALALGMVVLIGLVMIFYAWVQRRTQRWLA
jgi:putative spermidine/putrescine transport system permease protein